MSAFVLVAFPLSLSLCTSCFFVVGFFVGWFFFFWLDFCRQICAKNGKKTF